MPTTQIDVVLPTDHAARKQAKNIIEHRVDGAIIDPVQSVTYADNGAIFEVGLIDLPDEQIVAVFRMLANLALRPESGFHRPAFNGYNPIPNEQREFTA